MLLARVDYKPINFKQHGNVFNAKKGVQTDIQDFMAGISYQIDKVKPLLHHMHNYYILYP